MSADNRVLLVDRAQGAISSVMEELDFLGFRVIWVPTLSAALDFVKAGVQLSLVIVSAAAAEDGGREFLVQLKELHPSLPVIWGIRGNASPRAPRGPSPDSMLPEPMVPAALRGAVSALLAEHFYPKLLADAIKDAALAVLGELGRFTVEGGEFLVANQAELSDFSSIISFSGDASGHLIVGATTEHARVLHRSFVKEAHFAAVDRLEDLIGELCNQILGRINAFFARHTMSIQQTTPIFIRAAGSTMRYPGRHPSFGVQVSNGDARLSLQYYLATFDKSKLLGGATEAALDLGEIRYL